MENWSSQPITVSLRAELGLGPEVGNELISSQRVPIGVIRPCEMSIFTCTQQLKF